MASSPLSPMFSIAWRGLTIPSPPAKDLGRQLGRQLSLLLSALASGLRSSLYKVWTRPVALASSENLLEMQKPEPYLRPTESKSVV